MFWLREALLLLIALICQQTLAGGCGKNGALIYKDSSCSVPRRAEDLLSRMSWEDKVKQLGGIRQVLSENMLFNETKFKIFNDSQNGNIGFGNEFNPAIPALKLVNQLREKQTSSGLGIPYVLVSDSVTGIYLFNGTLFPATLSVASSFNVPLYGKAVASIREECRAIGMNWLLSPELDVVTDPRYGRVGETYGEDPYLNGEFGLKYVQTMQERDENGYMKIATTIKHFVYGWQTGGTNLAHIYGGLNHIYNDMLPPYIRIIDEAKPASLMVSYSSVDRVPMTANKFMINDVLREDLGFEGVVMSDAGGINNLWSEFKIAPSSHDAALLAVRAGLQMELSPGKASATQTLVNVTDDSEITSLVNNATSKLLEIKFDLGLFDQPLPSVSNAKKVLRAATHLEVARNISRESIVLLQNDGLLPLQEREGLKVAVLGPYASIIVPGSYSPHSTSDTEHGNSLLQSLQQSLGTDNVLHEPAVDFLDTTNRSGIARAVTAAKSAGLAVVNVGSLSVYSSDPLDGKRTDGEFYSHADLGFPGLQQQLIDAVLETGVPTILILTGGQAFVLNNSTLRANAILHTFLGGEFTGDAAADILLGLVNPSGKLPISIPQANGAFPVAYNWLPSDNAGGKGLGEPIYGSTSWQFPALNIDDVPMAFGYGLSYTTFNITGIDIQEEKQSNGNVTFEISVQIANTGDSVGKEVVQVYFSQALSIIELPVKRLIRFTKVEIEPGQLTTVKFSVPQKELGYYLNAKWTVEKGSYTFYVGSSSRATDLQVRNVTVS